MSKLLRINDQDLSELERIMPELAQALMPTLNNKLRVQLRRCQTILSNVRWGYGPPSEAEIIPFDGDNAT